MKEQVLLRERMVSPVGEEWFQAEDPPGAISDIIPDKNSVFTVNQHDRLANTHLTYLVGKFKVGN